MIDFRFLSTGKFKELEEFFIEKDCPEYVEKLKKYCSHYGKYVANWGYFLASNIAVVVFNDYSIESFHLG
jgi:hypothetical protein